MSRNAGPRASGAPSKKEQKAQVAELLARAVQLQSTGRVPDAQAVCRQLLKLAPRHFDALYLLGMSEYYAQSYQEAERHLRKAVEAEPRSAKAHLNRGVVLLEEAAERDWVLVLDHEPGNPAVRVRSDGKGWYKLVPEAI